MPNQWHGSVEHFYHFLLGYLYPVALMVEAQRLTRVTLRDCGPLSPWFGLLNPATDVEVVSPGAMLRRFAGDRQPSVVLKPYDDPASFQRQFLRAFGDLIRINAGADTDATSTDVVILDRRPGSAFYAPGNSESPKSGADRRTIPNVDAIAEQMDSGECVRLIDAAELDPAGQVRALAAARVLVAQHGAGLAHMLWLAPGSIVVEILPPRPPSAATLFRRLADALGHDYRVVPQEHDHAPVDPGSVVAAVG